jgi:carboxyl-terminal processing protease
LIDKNAKWLSENQLDMIIPLSYTAFKSDLESHNLEAKQYESINKYQSGLKFYSNNYEKELVTKDSLLAKKREIWHKELTEDIYLEEAIRIVKDLKVKPSIAVSK